MNDVVIKSTGPAPAHSTPTLGASGKISDPPPALVRAEPGHIVRGSVIGADERGAVLIRSDSGTFKLSSPHPPPLGSQVTLQIRQSGPIVQVLILRVEGGTPSGEPGPIVKATALPGPTATGLPPIKDLLQINQRVTAVLQVAPSNRSALPVSLQDLSVGQTLQLRIVGIGVASAAAAPAALSAPAGNGTEAIRAAGQPAANPVVSGPLAAGAKVANAVEQAGSQAVLAQRGTAPPLPGPGPLAAASQPPLPGTTPAGPTGTVAAPTSGASSARNAPASVVVAGQSSGPPQGATSQVAASSQISTAASRPTGAPTGLPSGPTLGTDQRPGPNPSPALAGPAGPLRFTALVTHTDLRGLPVLQSPVGTLQLDLPIPLPRGASLAFEVLPSSLTGLTAGTPVSSGTQPWPGMHELAGLVAGDPGLRALAELFLPQVGGRLAAGILVFLTALRGGRVDGWLGAQLPAIRALKDGRLLDKLGEDFSRLSRSVEGSGGEWRMHFIPVLGDARLEQLRLFLRTPDRDRDQAMDGPDEPTGRANRFVIEAALKRLGVLQLDGLVLADKNRFDLVLRSDRTLSAQARQKIRALFQDSSRAAGLTGEIAFHGGDAQSLLRFDAAGPVSNSGDTGLAQRA